MLLSPTSPFCIAQLTSDDEVHFWPESFTTRYEAQRFVEVRYPLGKPDWIRVVSTTNQARLKGQFASVAKPRPELITAELAGFSAHTPARSTWVVVAERAPIIAVTAADIIAGGSPTGDTLLDLVIRHTGFRADVVEAASTQQEAPELFTFVPFGCDPYGFLLWLGPALDSSYAGTYRSVVGQPAYMVKATDCDYASECRDSKVAARHHIHGIGRIIIDTAKLGATLLVDDQPV